MLKSIHTYINGLYARKGHLVLLATLLARAFSFLTTVAIIRILDKGDYGTIVYTVTFISFLSPLSGLGITHGLLRFGALCDSQNHKKAMFQKLFWRGFLGTLAVAILILLIDLTIPNILETAKWYIAILSLQLFGTYSIELSQTYARTINRNSIYSRIDIQSTFLVFLFSVPLAYYYGPIAYIISLVVIPILIGCYYLIKLDIISFNTNILKLSIPKTLYSYGIQVSFSNMLSQMLFAMDILLIGYLMLEAEPAIAHYKVTALIPFSFMLLARSTLATDFVHIARIDYKDPFHVRKYYYDFLMVFIPVCLGALLIFIFFPHILILLFGSEYIEHSKLLSVFGIASIGSIILRIPLGNILSAMGYAKHNTVIALVSIVVNVVLGYLLILKYGLWGAAYSTCVIMWISGLLSLSVFYYKTSNKN